ncbi:hypothetical protein P4380_33595, partial [Bacillus thuringiensis]|nr:hypothetical protein [Bacillus cereus]MED3221162.1 hypothetical protein [Bacillus thuringiensis]MED3244860.1 hypothetical protein [Bacillus thuringiensis]
STHTQKHGTQIKECPFLNGHSSTSSKATIGILYLCLQSYLSEYEIYKKIRVHGRGRTSISE